MRNDSVAEVLNILATSRSRGNEHCSYQHYQPGKITLQVSVLIIEYFRGGSGVRPLIVIRNGKIVWKLEFRKLLEPSLRKPAGNINKKVRGTI